VVSKRSLTTSERSLCSAAVASTSVLGLTIAYDLVGDAPARTWVVTPGGRFSKDDPGLAEMAEGLAGTDGRVLLWDRPNCGASDVCFEGSSESALQADVLAALLDELELGPAVVVGGSGGARVSLLAAARHPHAVAGLAMWWITGRPLGLLSLATHYCSGSLRAAWDGGMEAVAELPEWAEVIERNPANHDRFLALDPAEFIATMERWMVAYSPSSDDVVPGLPPEACAAVDVPTLVLRSGEADLHHPRSTSEEVAARLPRARLEEPPWGDREWRERQDERNRGVTGGLFVRWPLLVPQLRAWADDVLPDGW
jgi:pimeloyl-ACP methyl ester carboxylesterase